MNTNIYHSKAGVYLAAVFLSGLLLAVGTSVEACEEPGHHEVKKLLFTEPHHAAKQATGDEQKQTPATGWYCPMHPEVHKHEPGKCPVCKMKLIKTKPKSV